MRIHGFHQTPKGAPEVEVEAAGVLASPPGYSGHRLHGSMGFTSATTEAVNGLLSPCHHHPGVSLTSPTGSETLEWRALRCVEMADQCHLEYAHCAAPMGECLPFS